jgi:hypothetical protein
MTSALHKKGLLSTRFGRLARRIVTAGMLTLGVLAPSDTGRQAAAKDGAKDTIALFHTHPETETMTPLTAEMRAEINSTLVYEAQLNYYALAQTADNGYSRFLDSLETELNHFLKRTDTSIHSQIAIIDPIRTIDIPLALGIDKYMAIEDDVFSDSLHNMPKTILKLVASHVARQYTTAHGQTHYTQHPTTLHDHSGGGASPVIIVPMAYDAHDLQRMSLAGFNHQERVKIVTMHEAWHAIDTRYHLHGIEDSAGTFNASDARAMLDSKNALDILTVMHKKECFADVATLGEMIFRGHDTSILPRLSAVRDADDIVHQTAPVIDGLSRQLDKTGLDAFRRMPESARIDLYYAVTEKHAMQKEDFTTLYLYCTADRDDQVEIAREPQNAKAIDLLQRMQHKAAIPTTRSPDIARQIDAWNALEEMTSRAWKHNGVVTPESIIGAFGRMQDELWRQSIADPGNDLYPEMMTKMKKTLYDNLTTLDYAAINQSRGVNTQTILHLHKPSSPGM